MTDFEKIIIPLVDDNIKSIDLTSVAGFIDSFTSDPDNPSGEKELFLVYNDRIRNNYTIDRARRFENSPYIKRKYVKYVNGIPYYVYSFWIKPDIKKLYNGIVCLSTVQKSKILQFWSLFNSIVDKVMANSVLVTDVGHPMPLSDYREEWSDDYSLAIQKGDSLEMRLPPYFFHKIIERS